MALENGIHAQGIRVVGVGGGSITGRCGDEHLGFGVGPVQTLARGEGDEEVFEVDAAG